MEFALIILVILLILGFYFRNNIEEKFSPKKDKNYTIDDRFNAQKVAREKEIDLLLSKMGKNGIDDLSIKDKQRLEELSKK